MKKLYLGDIISSDKYDDEGKIISSRNSGLQQEFYEVNDELSARTLNRPIREAYEDAEADYVNLQTADKVLLGQKENGIIPDVLEEFSSNGVVVGKFFNKENFIRVPTGGLYVKAKNEFEKDYAFTFTEDQQYKKDIFIDNDHLALTVIHRPNIELFERQIAEHFCFDLNNQNTDIKIDYKVYDEDKEQKILYSYDITFNEYIYTEKTVNLTDDSETPTTFMDIAPAFRRITSEGEDLHNIFDIIKSIEGKLGSHLTEENNFFSLEEIINIAGLDEDKVYSIVVNLDTDDSNWEKFNEVPEPEEYNERYIIYTGETILGTRFIKGNRFRSNGLQWIPVDIRYSYSRRFAILEAEEVDYYNSFVKIYNVTFDRGENNKLICEAAPFLEKIDRTTLHIKNIINTNTINRLVVERVNSNINLSEGHFPWDDGDDNLTIGLKTLGFGIVIENGLKYYYIHEVLDWITEEFDYTHWYTHNFNDMNLELKDGHDLIHEMDELTLVLDDEQIHNSIYRIRRRFLLITSDKNCEHILTDRKLTLVGGYELLHYVTRRFLHLDLKNDYERDPTLYDENYKTEVGKRNIAIGNGALKITKYVGDDEPTDNIGIGYNALSKIQNGHENIELGGQDNVIKPNKLLNIGYNLNNPKVMNIAIGEKNMFVGYHNGCQEPEIRDNNIVIGFDNDSLDNSILFGKSIKNFGENNFIIGNGISTSESNQFLLGGNEELNYFDPTGVIKKSKYFIKATSNGEYQLQFFADKVRFHTSMITINGRIKTDALTITSLRSSKTDITPTKHNAVEEINKIQIVDFFYKDDIYKSTPKIGFIADDTDIIFSTPAKNSMDVYNCIGMLMKAVQELSAENKLLKEKLNLGD